jgi:exonuclease SbcD
MRILHTSDWHVGRTIRGRSREEEHRAVLDEIAGIARQEGVDLVVLAGDVFDTSAPSPAAEEVVYEALLRLTEDGRQVAAVSGNHDNGRRFTAIRPFLALARVHALGELARPEDGGCIDVTVGGETARLALLPWLSQRGIVRAEQLMRLQQGEQQQRYQRSARSIIGRLCDGFGNATINILVGHLTITGAEMGGGERQVETIFDYWVPPQFLPQTAHYCALGHIHRQQRIGGAAGQAWYCGSPLQLDFGEKPGVQGVLVFEAKPGVPVKEVQAVPLRSGRPLVTVEGTLELALTRAVEIDPRAHVRVRLDEDPRPGLAEQVYRAIPNAVWVELRPRTPPAQQAVTAHGARSPHDLYAAYLEQRGVRERAPLLALFDELVGQVQGATN